MEIQRRTRDVNQVFDSQWSVNHNYQEVKKFHNERKKHFQQMYNIREQEERKKEILRISSVDGKLETLNQKMSAMNANARLQRGTDFKNNFR